MSTAVLTRITPNRWDLNSVAGTAMKAAERFWFGVTLIGQLAFGFAVTSFYSLTALRGDYHAWNFTHGYVPGVTQGNFAVVMHLISAAIIMLAGAIQLAPQVRNRFPAFHRWNGRVYMLTAGTLSLAGLYMHWVRGSVGDLSQHIGGTVNAALIWICGGMALHYALARDFKTHRRWALRLFLVVSASWFIRIMLFLWFMIFRAPVGLDPTTFTGPLPTTLSYAQYLIPLAVLEIYLRAKDSPRALRRMATAVMLFVVTLVMVAGLLAVTMAIWVPQVKAAFDFRKSIAETLSATISSSGVDQAVQQYHDLKAAQSSAYNFDEEQLNSLGYRLIREKKFAEAVRIFQLNVEDYPKSGNVYDSLAEGYMDAGNKAQAIANYQRALQLNPKNLNAKLRLQKLNTR
jgi:tetratricopeptide (TPR) repeat protein